MARSGKKSRRPDRQLKRKRQIRSAAKKLNVDVMLLRLIMRPKA